MLSKCVTGTRKCPQHPGAQSILLLAFWWHKKEDQDLSYNQSRYQQVPVTGSREADRLGLEWVPDTVLNQEQLLMLLGLFKFSKDGQLMIIMAFSLFFPNKENFQYFPFKNKNEFLKFLKKYIYWLQASMLPRSQCSCSFWGNRRWRGHGNTTGQGIPWWPRG